MSLRFIIASYLLLTLFITNCFANGAATAPGLGSGNLVLYNGKPAYNLYIDEFVNIDLSKNKLDVSYVIDNPGENEVILPMAFPVAVINGSCDVFLDIVKTSPKKEDRDLEHYFDFSVKLNDKHLTAKYKPPQDISLPNNYRGLKDVACAYYTFTAKLTHGHNEIIINHRITPSETGADGLGDWWDFTYPIWSAKNWVTDFHIAKWRITLPPTDLEAIKDRQGDSLLGFQTPQQPEIDIKAPGKLLKSNNVYLYTATNFAPSGEINIRSANRDITTYVKECDEGTVASCWKESFLTYINKRGYAGDVRCYNIDDLSSIIIDRGDVDGMEFYPSALPYIRNEIFARHGYKFKNRAYRDFFGSTDWYFPKKTAVEINDIEKFNVKYIQTAEQYASQIYNKYFYDFETDELKKERKKLCESD